MEVKYNVTGERRKEMVEVISGIVGMKAVYMRMPTCAYAISNFKVSKEGTLIFDDRSSSEVVEKVLEGLAHAGFEAENAATEAAETANEDGTAELSGEPENEPQEANVGLTVALPREGFTDNALENLQKLVDSKAVLMKKALGVDALPVEVTEDKVFFPWFAETDSDSAAAYTHFITALCDMAKNQKRITAKERDTENEKYAFRCFLLRLGFIGTEYKAERKILLRNLSGNSAFRSKPREELLRPEPVNLAMRVDTQEHPDLTDELLDELLIQQVNNGFGGDGHEISE